MSESSNPTLSEGALESALAGLPGWAIKDGMLAKTFSFNSYAQGLAFAAAAGWAADKMDHHPDLMIGYQKVSVATVTHDAGGLTAKDTALAAAIQALAV